MSIVFTHVEEVVFFKKKGYRCQKEAVSQAAKDDTYLKKLSVLVSQDQSVMVNQHIPKYMSDFIFWYDPLTIWSYNYSKKYLGRLLHLEEPLLILT